MKKLICFIFLLGLVSANTKASVQTTKRPIDLEFDILVQKLIDMQAIYSSEVSEYESGYHKFYQFAIDKKKMNMITNFETKCLYPHIASAYNSQICKEGALCKFVSIGYGKDNSLSFNLGGYKDRNYDILYIRDPINKEKRFVYALVWWLKGKKVNGRLLKFYNPDPVIQREKTDSIKKKIRGIRMEDSGLTYLDSGNLGKITDFDINQNTTSSTSASVLSAVSSVCTAYISLTFSNKNTDKTREQRMVLASRLVTLGTKGRGILTANDRKTCVKLVENLRTCETDVTNNNLLMSALTLLKYE